MHVFVDISMLFIGTTHFKNVYFIKIRRKQICRVGQSIKKYTNNCIFLNHFSNHFFYYFSYHYSYITCTNVYDQTTYK